ncbi:carbamoyltransferase HypF [Olsenella sp. HMSC062G07]|uniref:carbamoyltransferase HypF n=1 Tax=Olsenella sp. HMSC062G07 TaxID=1739330 RepID=UPI0008A5546D|nr:carbamoyltransferase HypF [Olsenella sp. HMSC062G07]OFK24805.1 carbamoyltransferase HypF [Olsenella sp. HMSC062G07]
MSERTLIGAATEAGHDGARPVTHRLRVHGIVQGVGFRPTVDRHAATAGVCGSVCNKGPYVEIYAQGTADQVREFERLVCTEPPRRADIVRLESQEVPTAQVGRLEGFRIVVSEKTAGEVFVSPDIAICDDCRRELFDPTNRRYLHPFINCTCCGPRLTILDALPYDRERTSMRAFPLCPDCAREYHDPASRRYDAQPVCCNDCGPAVYLLGRDERGAEAITATRRCLAAGGIVAVKGIGGFHLCCDATNEDVVSRLRRRKRRPSKPLAVMMADEGVVRRECELSDAQREVLTGHQRPILLLRRRSGGRVAPCVAPQAPSLGVMLPYAPVQLLLFAYDDDVMTPDVLVMTSANVSGAPICKDDDDVREQLGGIADLVLSHDRTIRTRADDSVMDWFEERPYMVRRSRGYAPLPVVLSTPFRHDGRTGTDEDTSNVRVLAVGGELKNTFCVGTGGLFYPSAYVGDLADLRAVHALEASVGRMEALLEVAPEVVACDLHPRYHATSVAQRMAQDAGVPLVRVQHHFAHVVSCMAENDVAEPVVGVSFDGTGYGEDGSVWGGELMVCDFHGFERVGRIAPFCQAGGDAAALEGWRVAVSLLGGLTGLADDALDETLSLVRRLGLCSPQEARAQLAMTRRRVNAVTSTSAGRLFDAVSALLGVSRASSFEGESAVLLQRRAECWAAEQGSTASAAGLPMPGAPAAWTLGDEGLMTLPTDRLVGWLVARRLAGDDAGRLAYAFHVGLARQAAEAARWVARRRKLTTVALSGGCFQNTLLLALVKDDLEAAGLRVLTHRLIPPNDGGICLGQAVVAAQALQDGRVVSGTSF